MSTPTDITDRTDEAAIALLVSFGEAVSTKAGRVESNGKAFLLTPINGKAKSYETAAPAVRALRKLRRAAA